MPSSTENFTQDQLNLISDGLTTPNEAFNLDEGSFDFALDLVLHKERPLFLQYPVSFSCVPVNANK